MQIFGFQYCLYLVFFGLRISLVHPKRIYGGRPAKLGEYPALAALTIYKNGKPFCGGSILSKRFVLTAAHCLNILKKPNRISRLGIMVGDIYGRSSSKNSPKSRQHIKSESFIVHEEYNKARKINDIALIIVRKDFIFSKNVKPILMAFETPAVGSKCQVVGFGRTEIGTRNNQLLATEVLIHSNWFCRKFTAQFDGTRQICSGDLTGQNDSCQGDSGGPLIYRQHIIGIVSYGYGCAVMNYAAVYTDITFYRDWVNKSLNGEIRVMADCKDPIEFSCFMYLLIIAYKYISIYF